MTHRIYELHVRPVEHEHAGEYALVTPDGRTFFAPTLGDIMILANERANPSNAIFKVGDVVLGKIR